MIPLKGTCALDWAFEDGNSEDEANAEDGVVSLIGACALDCGCASDAGTIEEEVPGGFAAEDAAGSREEERLGSSLADVPESLHELRQINAESPRKGIRDMFVRMETSNNRGTYLVHVFIKIATDGSFGCMFPPFVYPKE